MKSRNEILNRLRKAKKKELHMPPVAADKILFADYPQDKSILTEIFSTQLSSLSGEIFRFNTFSDAANTLVELIKNVDRGLCLAQRTTEIEQLFESNKWLTEYFTFLEDIAIDSEEFAKYEIAITGADYLIARTGSIFLRSATAGGRRLSVLPPTHIIIARENQIVYSLDDVFKQLDRESGWSYATFITGPSRTSDIEKQLVLGAHGPKRLIVLLIKD
ncbi:MAG: lactate utilization protein C [Anaerolineales bacterium]